MNLSRPVVQARLMHQYTPVLFPDGEYAANDETTFLKHLCGYALFHGKYHKIGFVRSSSCVLKNPLTAEEV